MPVTFDNGHKESNMKDLKFIAANADLPRGMVTSTARRGTKWSTDVKAGDVVNLLVTESGANIGRAAIVAVQVKPLKTVCDECINDNNHTLQKIPAGAPGIPAALLADLKAAYGDDLK